MAGLLDFFSGSSTPGMYNSGGGFDAATLIPLLSAAAGANQFGASRLPITNGQVMAGAINGYVNGLKAQQEMRAAQLQNEMGGLTLQGYQKLQAMNGGGAPTAQAGILGATQPQQSSGGLLSNIGHLFGLGGNSPSASATGNPAADADGVFHTLVNSAPGTTMKLPGIGGAYSNTATTIGPNGEGADGGGPELPLSAAPGQQTPLQAHANGFDVGAPNPGLMRNSSQPQPLFSLPALMGQYRIMAATPGMQQGASQILSLIEKGLPEGAQINTDGSLSARPGYNKFVTDKAMGEKGFVPGPNGTYAPAPGGEADPRYQQQLAGSKEAGAYPYKLALETNKPYALRGPGASLIQGGRVVAQNPYQVESVDAQGHPYTSFILPPVGGNGGLLSGATVPNARPGLMSGGAPAPANGLASNVPLAFPAAAGNQPAPAASAGGPNISVAPNGMPVIQKGLSPLEESSAKERGNKLETFGEQLDKDAEAAQQNNFLLDNMRRESTTWNLGKFADVKNNALAYLQGFANTFGIPTTGMDQRIGDFQAFNKSGIELVRQAVRQTSARAAYQEFQIIAGALPNAEMSPKAFSQIADQMQGVGDYRIAMQSAAQSWRSTHNGTLDGFQQAWNQSITPAAFLVHRMSGDDLATMTANLQKTAEGRGTLAKLQQEIATAQHLGLFNDTQ
jgi:hypothetical protein